jgi:hypothetical protein
LAEGGLEQQLVPRHRNNLTLSSSSPTRALYRAILVFLHTSAFSVS